jgi:hypothetical protein
MARASRPLLGVRAAEGRLRSGRLRPRMSQAPLGDGSGEPRGADFRLDEADLDKDERRSVEGSDGRADERDLSL